jgi:hypothetical protein
MDLCLPAFFSLFFKQPAQIVSRETARATAPHVFHVKQQPRCFSTALSLST